MKTTFAQTGDFSAMNEAEKFLEANGYSIGSCERGSPRGILKGDWTIAKWRNLDKTDVAAMHGKMTGDMRNGPVLVELFEESAA
jgi:hypothetical protein